MTYNGGYAIKPNYFFDKIFPFQEKLHLKVKKI